MIDPKTGLQKPYSISVPLFNHSRYGNYECDAYGSKTFSHDGQLMSSIPRSIIIALNRNKDLDPLDKTTAFGLITNLKVKINSSITVFQDLQSLIAVAQTSGYQELDVGGMITKGFAVRLPCDTTLNLPPDSVVGKAGSYTLSVSGNFTNQSSSKQTFDLTITVVSDAELQYADERFALASGVTIPGDLLNNKNFLRDLYSENMQVMGVLGGLSGAGIFGDAARWIKKNGANLAKTAWNNREGIAQTVGDVLNTVKMLRGGESGGRLAQYNVSGGARGTTTLGGGSVSSNVFKKKKKKKKKKKNNSVARHKRSGID
jgi:hypothetical protein